jgi:hypothetical protein
VIFYVVCFTEDDGIYYCGHLHKTVAEAMSCLVPDGGTFIRSYEEGVSRSLDPREFIDFLEALGVMPWSARGAKVLEEK